MAVLPATERQVKKDLAKTLGYCIALRVTAQGSSLNHDAHADADENPLQAMALM